MAVANTLAYHATETIPAVKSFIVQASGLPTNIRLDRKGLPGTNTSLLRNFVNYGCKKFYNIGPWKDMHDPFLFFAHG